MAGGDPTVRPFVAEDMPALLDLWVASWQVAYPAIDFSGRRGWAESHFGELSRHGASILVLRIGQRLAGAVTIEPATGYIDQIVVAHDLQRRGLASRLIAAARAVSPALLELHVNQDNAAAVAFYLRDGFVVSDHNTNPRSGAPTYRMTWRALTGEKT